jgi:hypothetical protein
VTEVPWFLYSEPEVGLRTDVFCGKVTEYIHPVWDSPKNLAFIAAARTALPALLAENEKLRAALEWYGEQARLARLIHSEGDAGRYALAADGGKRARVALETKPGA